MCRPGGACLGASAHGGTQVTQRCSHYRDTTRHTPHTTITVTTVCSTRLRACDRAASLVPAAAAAAARCGPGGAVGGAGVAHEEYIKVDMVPCSGVQW